MDHLFSVIVGNKLQSQPVKTLVTVLYNSLGGSFPSFGKCPRTCEDQNPAEHLSGTHLPISLSQCLLMASPRNSSRLRAPGFNSVFSTLPAPWSSPSWSLSLEPLETESNRNHGLSAVPPGSRGSQGFQGSVALCPVL